MAEGHLPVTSYLAVPVISRSGEVLGGLFFGHPDPDMFSERDEMVVAGLAAQAAVAMDNAHLYETAKRARGEAERAAAEQERLYRQAEESSRLKEEFLATISHELRTPLSAILGWARMLRTGQLSEGQAAKALDTIERNARAQAQLVDDLLDVSRIITGKLRMDVQPADPNSFIDAAVEAVRPAAEAKGVRVQKVIDTAVISVPGAGARNRRPSCIATQRLRWYRYSIAGWIPASERPGASRSRSCARFSSCSVLPRRSRSRTCSGSATRSRSGSRMARPAS